MPFLRRVVQGRGVPEARLEAVAEHYSALGGSSPQNGQMRSLRAAVAAELVQRGCSLPVYWGNRNWHPFLEDTIATMARDGVRAALALYTSPFGGFASCRQYSLSIEAAAGGLGAEGPRIHKLRAYFNHPNYVEAVSDLLRSTWDMAGVPERVIFAAHSVPASMPGLGVYTAHLMEACRLVADRANSPEWELAYQSRSGSPGQAWLEPDVCDRLRDLAGMGVRRVSLCPIGFISDNMEVIYDLDTEAVSVGAAAGIVVQRVPTVGLHGAFVGMITDLVEERLGGHPRHTLGSFGPAPDTCPPDCCQSPPARPGTDSQS